MLEHGHHDRALEKVSFLYDLVDVALVPALTMDGIKSVRTFFYNRLKSFWTDEDAPVSKPNATRVSGEEAAMAIINAIELKKRTGR